MTDCTRPSRIALPVDRLLSELVNAVRLRGSVLFMASPGSGKTTRIPWALAEAFPEGKVYVLEPRRIAAKLSAERVAEENGASLGEEVGYQFRFERKRKDSTRLVFLTEGTLLRELQSNPTLKGVSVLVLDEFHERHLQGDLALAIAKRLQETTRSDLKIVVMSATLDPVPLEKFLPGTQRIELEAPRFPIEIEYAPLESTLEREVSRKVRDLLNRPDQETFGDLLVFLPGMAEIRRVEGELRGLARVDVLVLHGELSREEQDRALGPSTRRKVILSTNIAESSVTIPGVNTVVDAGLARVGSFSHWAGLPRLETKAISRASAIQRAGRAGRTGPGRVVRLYARGDFESRAHQDTPEILRADLAPVALDLLALGIDPKSFRWFESPSMERVDSALDLLRMLGLVDSESESPSLTPWGEAASESAFHPRVTRALLESARLGVERDAIPALLALSEGEALGLDFLQGLQRYSIGGFQHRIRERMESAVASYRKLVPSVSISGDRDSKIARVLLSGFHDRVGRRSTNSELVLAAGGSVALSRRSAGASFEEVDPFWSHSEFFLVLDLQESKRAGDARAKLMARSAVAITESDLWEIEPLPLREKIERVFDDRKKRWVESDLLIFHKLELSRTLKETALSSSGGRSAGAEDLPEAEWQTLFRHWLEELRGEETKTREAWTANRIRYRLLRKTYPELYGDEDFEALLRRILFENYRSVHSAKDLPDLGTVLNGLWNPEAFRKFRDEVPETVELPGRKQTPVIYEEGGPPRIESRMADFFGTAEVAKILGGRMKLSLHLLAPNYRAVQVTEDLAGFWQKHYPAIRKELMRQYPRHPWPENPLIRPPARKK